MPDDYYDEGSDESRVDDQVDVPEEKLGLVPMSFFKSKVSPGDKEQIEVVKVYDDEVAIKCIYSKDKEESSEDEDTDTAGPSEAQADELMG
jgi:hypothetical protein